MTAKERLMKFIEYKNLNVNVFLKNCGISLGYMSAMQPDANFGTKIQMRIAQAYPELNIAWLVMESGEMLKPIESQDTQMEIPMAQSVPIKELIAVINTKIESNNNMISAIIEQNRILQQCITNVLEYL